MPVQYSVPVDLSGQMDIIWIHDKPVELFLDSTNGISLIEARLTVLLSFC